MSVTINYAIKKDKKRKDGTYTIYLRITENRDSKYIATKHSVHLTQWNENRKQVNRSHPLHTQINRSLENYRHKADAIKLELQKQGELSAKSIISQIRGEKPKKTSLLETARYYLDDLKKKRNFSEYKRFKVLVNQLESFLSDESISIKKFDSNKVEEFRDFLLYEIGNNNNTVRRKLRSLKAFTKTLLKSGKIEEDPFRFVELPKSLPTDIATLSIEQINKIENLNLPVGSELWHARNFFLYSFYNAGIRFGDLCTLKWENIRDGNLTYQMRKTKKYKKVPQIDEALRILKGYGYPDSTHSTYIFPILKKYPEDIFELKKEISTRNVKQNLLLKELAKKANIDQNISTHMARHSFAHYALKNDVNVYAISKLLGHSSLKVTEIYLKSIDIELVEKELKKIF